MADLGVMEMCLLVSDFSPLTERRNACVELNLDRNVGLKFGVDTPSLSVGQRRQL
jgi:hypothetical protein